MKPATENLLWALEMVINAHCEKRSDIPAEIMIKIAYLRNDLQYLKEIDCE